MTAKTACPTLHFSSTPRQAISIYSIIVFPILLKFGGNNVKRWGFVTFSPFLVQTEIHCGRSFTVATRKCLSWKI